jgi:hypothetical protein
MGLTNFENFKEFHPSIIGGAGQSLEEAFNLCKYVEKTNLINGDLIEVGVWNGGSAQILNRYKSKNKKLFLFDTFDGLKDCNNKLDGDFLENGMMVYDYNYVVDLFKDNEDVIITKGYFPKSAKDILTNKLSFVHIDVDTYQSTLNGLNFLYDKMEVGGVIVIHDYVNNPHTKGVLLAVDEFLENKIEKIIVPEGKTQGVIIKL